MVDIVDPEIAESRRRWNVLVADADEDSLLSLEKAFEECDHKVTKCKNADECLAILQEKKGEFQLIIIEVSMPEIDGYELSRRIRKETDIPIILMSSAYSRDDSIPKVLECGASEFLLKPINAENLRNIKLDSLRNLIRQDPGGGEVEQEVSASISRDTTGHLEEGELDVVNPCSAEKRSGDSIAALDPPARKKQRVIWTTELHEKFVSAVTKFGLDHAVPKKIMEVMNVSGLTRENVASHLQKYRQYHKKKDGINISQPKQPSRRQQEHKRSKSSDEPLKENHELKALYPEPALPQATALEALDYKVHGGSKIGCQQVQQGPLWTDDVLQQRGFQAPFVDHAASYHTNQMVPTYDHASFDPLIGWRQQPLPTYLNSVDHTEFVDASNEMCCQPLPYLVVHDQSAGQLPNETGGHDLFPQCDTDQLPGYHYHDDHVSGLHLVPKIEHSLDHLNIQMAGNTNLQGNTTTCYNYATTSTYYQQGGQLNFNATSVSTAGFEHHLYQDDHQASLVEDCQHMFSSSYYDHPPLYLDQPDPQVGPMIDQPHPMNQEGADEKIGFKELAEE